MFMRGIYPPPVPSPLRYAGPALNRAPLNKKHLPKPLLVSLFFSVFVHDKQEATFRIDLDIDTGQMPKI